MAETRTPRNTDEATGDCMIEHAMQNARKGDPESIINTIDDYCAKQAPWSMNVGPVKGDFVDKVFKECDPDIAVEFGSYIGYSAVRMARLLKPNGRLYCVEPDKHSAKLVQQLLEFAGLSDRVTIIIKFSYDAIPLLSHDHGIEKIDFVFVDHDKRCYTSDVKKLIDTGLLQKGSVVVADNILYPGVPDYAEFVRNCPRFRSTSFEAYNSYREVLDSVEKSVFLG